MTTLMIKPVLNGHLIHSITVINIVVGEDLHVSRNKVFNASHRRANYFRLLTEAQKQRENVHEHIDVPQGVRQSFW